MTDLRFFTSALIYTQVPVLGTINRQIELSQDYIHRQGHHQKGPLTQTKGKKREQEKNRRQTSLQGSTTQKRGSHAWEQQRRVL